jgi:hypothetical protein
MADDGGIAQLGRHGDGFDGSTPSNAASQREASGKYNGLEGTAWLTTSLEGAIKLTAIEVVTTGQGNDVIGAQILAHQSTFGQWILNHHQLFITFSVCFESDPKQITYLKAPA